ncbi:CDP-diacylglycerol--glycerol-3-phosphate 3-phosphatidyltransferase [Spirochaetia bacterium]|nr:CDP-diacylglycerol--glycerol-3-phosphate 3-phosphatidyltransferase [Spirochaetia bacterium]
MTLADKITASRLVLAPFFFIVYLLPVFFPSWFVDGSQWTVPVLWALFIVSEISDMIDGKVARSRKEVSDFGKLFDPFADTLVQITYFLVFVIDGIFPAALFLVVLYREFSILFIRNLMLKKGIAMGARIGGKIKTVTYIAAGAVALLAVSAQRLGFGEPVFFVLQRTALIIFLISVIISLVSFADYLSVYRKSGTEV